MSGPDYKIRWFQDDDLDYYIERLNNSLYSEYDKERFKWKFLENPYRLGFTSIAIVEDEKGDLVGFNAFLPLRLNTGRAVIPVVQGCDGYIQREHRRKGLFQKTIHFMSDYLASSSTQVLIGFNFVESLGAAKKAGSVSSATVNRWFIDPETIGKHDPIDPKTKLKKAGIDEIHELYSAIPSARAVF